MPRWRRKLFVKMCNVVNKYVGCFSYVIMQKESQIVESIIKRITHEDEYKSDDLFPIFECDIKNVVAFKTISEKIFLWIHINLKIWTYDIDINFWNELKTFVLNHPPQKKNSSIDLNFEKRDILKTLNI